MPKREKRYHLYLDPDVVEWYKATFGGDLGLSRAIREVMRSYKAGIEAKIAAKHSGENLRKGLSDDEQQRIFGKFTSQGAGGDSGD